MTHEHNDAIFHDHNDDGVDRRGFLKCMAWAGTGAVWLVKGGVLEGHSLGRLVGLRPKDLARRPELRPDQRQPHGLQWPANTDVVATFQTAIDQVNALPTPPALMLHTGDISHLSKPEEFDTVQQMLKSASRRMCSTSRANTTSSNDDGKEYLARYGKGTSGNGWHSFDKNGVHFIGLVNVTAAARPEAWARWALNSSHGWRETSSTLQPARRSSSLRTFRSGPCIRSGAGAPRQRAGAGAI